MVRQVQVEQHGHWVYNPHDRQYCGHAIYPHHHPPNPVGKATQLEMEPAILAHQQDGCPWPAELSSAPGPGLGQAELDGIRHCHFHELLLFRYF
jgi:hypothetical protein